MSDAGDKVEEIFILALLVAIAIAFASLIGAFKDFQFPGSSSLPDWFKSPLDMPWSKQNGSSGAVPDYDPTLSEQAYDTEQNFDAATDPTQLIPDQSNNQALSGLLSAIPGELASDPGQFLSDNGIF
jgi:hypothetical protein